MKNKEEKKNRIWVPIVIGAVACSVAVGTGIALAHNQQRPKAGTVATVSDAIESVPSTTEVVEVTTEKVTTEVVIEAAVSGSEKPEAVPATTEIGGGKKKAEETTEEQKPSVSANGSGHSSTSSNGQSTAPKPSNSGSSSGNSGSSGSNNGGNSSGNSGSNNSNNGGSTNNTPQHQHNYNVWVKTKDVWDETVIDTPEQTIEHPAEGYWASAVQCHICGQIFTSAVALDSHPCGDRSWGTADDVWMETKGPWTETIPAKTHTVHHDEEGYWKCECGTRK